MTNVVYISEKVDDSFSESTGYYFIDYVIMVRGRLKVCEEKFNSYEEAKKAIDNTRDLMQEGK